MPRKKLKKEKVRVRKATASRRAEVAVRSVKVSKKPSQISPRSVSHFQGMQSYTSLLLGVLVVFIGAILLVLFLKNRNISNSTHVRQEVSSTKTVAIPIQVTSKILPKMYTVKTGDSLWDIAVAQYNDGYKWVEIAKANNLTNPGVLYKGTQLAIPTITGPPTVAVATATITSAPVQIAQKIQTMQPSNAITGNAYTVQKDDDLWHIAVRAYGDGYQYTKIAQANNLSNPSLIFSGNVLTIPR